MRRGTGRAAGAQARAGRVASDPNSDSDAHGGSEGRGTGRRHRRGALPLKNITINLRNPLTRNSPLRRKTSLPWNCSLDTLQLLSLQLNLGLRPQRVELLQPCSGPLPLARFHSRIGLCRRPKIRTIPLKQLVYRPCLTISSYFVVSHYNIGGSKESGIRLGNHRANS